MTVFVSSKWVTGCSLLQGLWFWVDYLLQVQRYLAGLAGLQVFWVTWFGCRSMWFKGSVSWMFFWVFLAGAMRGWLSVPSAKRRPTVLLVLRSFYKDGVVRGSELGAHSP